MRSGSTNREAPGVGPLDGGDDPDGGHGDRTGDRVVRVGQDPGVTAAGVEALEEAGEGLAVAGHHLAFEGLVVGVEADHPRAVPEVPGDHPPHLVELPLQVAHHVVLPEVGDGDVERAVAVVARPPTGDGHGRLAVGAEGPGGRPLTREGLGVDVLVHARAACRRGRGPAGRRCGPPGPGSHEAIDATRTCWRGSRAAPACTHRRLIGHPRDRARDPPTRSRAARR